MTRAARLLLLVAAGGLAEGLALALLTVLLSRSDLGTGNISLRGNGALVVPFGLGPALLAGQLAMLVLHLRGRRSWLGYGAGATAIGILFVLGTFLPALFLEGTASPGQSRVVGVQQFFTLMTLLWIVIAPVGALFLPGPPRGTRRRWPHLAAIGILPPALIAGLFGGLAAMSSVWQ